MLLAVVNSGPEDARVEIALKIVFAYIGLERISQKNTV